MTNRVESLSGIKGNVRLPILHAGLIRLVTLKGRCYGKVPMSPLVAMTLPNRTTLSTLTSLTTISSSALLYSSFDSGGVVLARRLQLKIVNQSE